MFDFYTAYRVTQSFPETRYVAIGAHETKNGDGIIYLIAGSDIGHKVVGPIIRDTGDTIEMIDQRNQTPDGQPVQMLFEVLTVRRLHEMVNDLSGGEALAQQLPTDKDVQIYYQTNFLEDYWEENYSDGLRYD